MQIPANASIKSTLSVWAVDNAPPSPRSEGATDPMAPEDTVELSTPPDTPAHAPVFTPADTQPDMLAGSPSPYNPSVQKELKQEDGFLDKQLSQGKHFVKLNHDGSRIGFAAHNINGDNVLYTGQPMGNDGMMVDGLLKYDKSDDGHITRTTYQASHPALMQFGQNNDGTLQYTTPPPGIFNPVRVDR